MSKVHDEFDDFFDDDPDDTPIVNTRADGRLLRVPLTRLAPNLVNPRTDFGTEDQLLDFGKSLARRQNQACPVVSRGAYLKLWPAHEDQVGDIDFVLVSGERRFRAATLVGLGALDCVVDDNAAADRKTFMEAVVSENVDRQNFDPVEEAYAVQALVAEFGSNRAVAQHFERADGWVTQRILLTNLAREVQHLVRTKAMPLDAARSLGKLARDNDWSSRDQLEWWETEQEKRSAASAARSAARKAVRQQPPAAPVVPESEPATVGAPSFTAVKQESVRARPIVHHTARPESSPATTEPKATAVDAAPIPEPRAVQPERDEPAHAATDSQVSAPRPFPYDEPTTAVLLCHKKMTEEDFVRAGEAWLRVLREQHPDAYKQLLDAQ